MKPSKNIKIAGISEDQYEVIKNIYSDKILENKPIIKIPDENKHIYVQLDKSLGSNTIKYPANQTNTSENKVYLLAKPKSVVHRILTL